MTSRLRTTTAIPNWDNYATLVAEATLAFSQDIVYAIQVVESARSISDKKRKALKRNQSKP
jgi:hypothetical protein